MSRDEQLEALRRKLDVSRQMGAGYAARIAEIERQIAALEAEGEDNP